jgi:hypothetical protein
MSAVHWDRFAIMTNKLSNQFLLIKRADIIFQDGIMIAMKYRVGTIGRDQWRSVARLCSFHFSKRWSQIVPGQ